MIILDYSAIAPQPSGPPADRVTAGAPVSTVRVAYESPDGKFSAGTWNCSPGRWRVRYDEYEYCRILAGSGAVIDAEGNARAIKSGDEFVIPAGFVGEWLVVEDMTKSWVIVTF